MSRVFHPWYKWECYRAGFYDTPQGDAQSNEDKFSNYFLDEKRFQKDCYAILKKWPHSCEHFLTNPNINKIAWIGQACVFMSEGVSPAFKYAYNNLPIKQRELCDKIALDVINEFSKKHRKKLYQQMEMHGVFL